MLTEEEKADIRALIRDAKYPVQQVSICAQLYCCTKQEVLNILPENYEWTRKLFSSEGKRVTVRHFTKEQKLDICRRYMSGERKSLQKDYQISGETIRFYVSDWKKLFPDEKWPLTKVQKLQNWCMDWMSGKSLDLIALQMEMPRRKARERMASYIKHHPEVFSGVEDKRKPERKRRKQ